MANKLAGAEAPPSPETVKTEPRAIQSCGWDIATGKMTIFDMFEGDKLPKGFVDSPTKCKGYKDGNGA